MKGKPTWYETVQKKVYMVAVRAMLIEVSTKTSSSIHFDREEDGFNGHLSQCIKIVEAKLME